MLIVSGQALFRESLRSAFESRPECAAVFEAWNLSKAMRAFEEHAIDIALLDCDMEGPLAVTLLKSTLATNSAVSVLILASLHNRVLAKQLMLAGAAGVVWKLSSMQDLNAGIRAALERRTWRDCRALRLREPARKIVSEFTERQKKVTQGVLQGRANKEIAAELSVSETSVKCTMRQLFSKTGTHSRSHLVRVLLQQLPMDELEALEQLA